MKVLIWQQYLSVLPTLSQHQAGLFPWRILGEGAMRWIWPCTGHPGTDDHLYWQRDRQNWTNYIPTFSQIYAVRHRTIETLHSKFYKAIRTINSRRYQRIFYSKILDPCLLSRGFLECFVVKWPDKHIDHRSKESSAKPKAPDTSVHHAVEAKITSITQWEIVEVQTSHRYHKILYLSHKCEESITCRRETYKIEIHIGFVTHWRRHHKFKTRVSVEFFLNEVELLLNLVNLGNLKNHWSMN